jgi:hypothetical protein
MDQFARPYIRDMLNKWLLPVEPWVDIPGVVTLCEYMFGEPWCELVLSGKIKNGIGGYHLRAPDIAPDRVVSMTRPPLLPGLCRGHLSIGSEILPADLGCAP